MKRTILFAMCLMALTASGQTIYDSIWRDDVKTVQLYRQGEELSTPVMNMGERVRLVLEFDVLRPEAEELRWHIVHCDRHWRPDGLEEADFMNGFAEGPMEEFDFSFTTRRDYVHYSTVLPAGYAEFTHSGNYVIYITSDKDTLLTRRFWVSEQSAGILTEVGRPYDGISVDRRQEVDVYVTPRSESLDERWMAVTVQQNGRLDEHHTLQHSGFRSQAMAFAGRPQNIFDGGNTFRFFDCSTLKASMYNVLRTEDYGGEWLVLLRPDEDRSRKHYLSETTLNGGLKPNTTERDNPRLEAEYVWVYFSLPMTQPMLDKNVHIVGDLTQWRMDSASRMDYDPQRRAYTKRMLLKQGYYSYQLLTSSVHKQSATATLEGDNYETPNRYRTFVYYRSPTDRADRLLATTTSVIYLPGNPSR